MRQESDADVRAEWTLARRMSEPRFFRSPAEWRAWLKKNHAAKTEIIVGIYKNGASKKGLTRQEMVDGALAYGWIDGHLRSLGEEAYQIRISPRRKGSIWSAVNIRRIGELIEAGAMAAPGLAAFRNRDPEEGIPLFLRGRTRALYAGTGESAPREPEGACLLPRTAAWLSPRRDPLGQRREAGSHENSPHGNAHQGLRGGKAAQTSCLARRPSTSARRAISKE